MLQFPMQGSGQSGGRQSDVDDADAVADAKQRLRESVIEVWQDTRRVAVVYPDNWSGS
jgi:hypothetical protein